MGVNEEEKKKHITNSFIIPLKFRMTKEGGADIIRRGAVRGLFIMLPSCRNAAAAAPAERGACPGRLRCGPAAPRQRPLSVRGPRGRPSQASDSAQPTPPASAAVMRQLVQNHAAILHFLKIN